MHADDRAGIAAIYGTAGHEEWLGPPTFEEPRCVRDGDPIELCFPSRGLEGLDAEVTILEVDQNGTSPADTLHVVIEPLDYVPETGRWETCLGWTARWIPDGPGHPEYVARVAIHGVAPATTPAIDSAMLHVGKTTLPSASGCP